MGDRSELNITISFTKEGTTYARMSKISGFGTTASAKLLRTGTAKCHPDDKFDPEVGSMIALARMFGNDLEFHTIEEKPKKKPERKLTDFEKDALKKGYTLVRDRLPSCTAYDGVYIVIDSIGEKYANIHWSHKHKTFSLRDLDNESFSALNIELSRKAWMDTNNPVIAWKVQPDKVEQKALDEGYTLCRDRYPDNPGGYDVTTEDGAFWHNLSWNGSYFGSTARLWMDKRENPAIAWKEHK